MATQEYPIDVIPDFENSPGHSSGDEEFGGPPAFDATIRLVRKPSYVLSVLVNATWREQKRDWTTFKISQPVEIANLVNEFGEDEAKKWNFVNYQRYFLRINPVTIPGVDQGLQLIYENQDGSALVSAVYVEGDSHSGGLLSGTDHPKIRIVFNPIMVGISDEKFPGRT